MTVNGLGVPSRVCVAMHIKRPVPFIEKNRASCSGGRFLPTVSFVK